MPNVTKEKIQGIVDKIVREFRPEKIILFGSFAWGKPTEESDVDLFVVKDTEDARDVRSRINLSFFPRDFPMDILVYTPKQIEKRKGMNDLFMREIFTKGTVLYG